MCRALSLAGLKDSTKLNGDWCRGDGVKQTGQDWVKPTFVFCSYTVPPRAYFSISDTKCSPHGFS